MKLGAHGPQGIQIAVIKEGEGLVPGHRDTHPGQDGLAQARLRRLEADRKR